MVISKCPSLEKLNIAAENINCDIETFSTSKFFDDFKDCIQMRNVAIEIRLSDQIIGTITRHEIVWRNKLVQWVGYNTSRNSSQTNLIDLANKTIKHTITDGKKHNNISPFDIILSFLDLNSLQSLCKTNRKCSQLVDNFVKQHSEQQHTFVITNEFFTSLNSDYKQLDNKFANYVTNLRVNIYNYNLTELRVMIEQFYNLNKLYVYTSGSNQPGDLIVPQVRHFIFDGKYFNKFSCLCPELESLELKQPNLHGSKSRVESLLFRKLEGFTYIFHYSSQVTTKKISTIYFNTIFISLNCNLYFPIDKL